jgi:hypothetical protein
LLSSLTEIDGREIVDLFRNHIGTSVVYVFCTQSSRLTITNTGPIRNAEFSENGPSMEITFFNPDDAMCVRHICPAFLTHCRPPQKISHHVRIHGLRTSYVSSAPFDTFNLQLVGECDGCCSHLLCRIGCVPGCAPPFTKGFV